jgi:hypothetical protein
MLPRAGHTKGGMNSKLHASYDSLGRPLTLFVTAGRARDDIGARALLCDPPRQMPKSFPLSHRACSRRHLLVMRPAPRERKGLPTYQSSP